MVMIPVSFALAAVLVVLLWREIHVFTSPNRNKYLIAFLALLIFQLLLVGLRFGYGLDGLRRVYPFGASLMGPLAYLSFYRTDADERLRESGKVFHLLPLLLVGVLTVLAPAYIDLLLGIVTLFYAGMLTRLGLDGHDALGWANLSRSADVFRTLWFCCVLLVLSGLTDLVIAFDFWRTGGSNIDSIVSKTIVIAIAWFGLALLIRRHVAASRTTGAQPAAPASADPQDHSRTRVIDATPSDLVSTEAAAQQSAKKLASDPGHDSDDDLLATVVASIKQQNLHLDANLNLNRLARRVGIVQRQVSGVINRKTGLSVSQFINGMRVDFACEQLIDTDLSVTEIMLAAGFNTKSNFNREFKRCTNMSPSAYRKSIRGS